MARPTNEQKLADVFEAALASFNRVQAAQRPERIQNLADRRFYSIPGAQWEGPLSDQFENRPRFEANKVHNSVIRIFNEYRNNRITVDFVAKDGAKNDRLADALDGLYRADEQDSNAEEAYDNAFEEAVGGGIGAWRLRACYEDEYDESDRQRVRIEPIYDADTCVFFDLDAKRQDKSDAKECWVLHSLTHEAFKEEYDEDPATWPKDMTGTQYDWCRPDLVYVAEYFKVETRTETMVTFRSIAGEEERYSKAQLDEDPDLAAGLAASGLVATRRKPVKSRKVRKYVMSGAGILEDCGYIAGKHIPVVPVFGKRWFVDGIERSMGQVRLAKDMQRLKNMQLSKLGEISALSSVEKPIVMPEQMAGHQTMWADDNLKNYPYLFLNPVTGPDGMPMVSGPVDYTRSPQIPPALAALIQITDADIAELLGSTQQADKMVSGVAQGTVELMQQRMDMQTYIYMSNMAKAMRRCGEIWLSMASELYTEDGRAMKSVGEMGETDSVILMEPYIDEKTGATAYANDLRDAKYDTVVDVGPSFTSRRDATVRAIMGMMAVTDDPAMKQVLQSMAIINMDGEGLSEVKEFVRKQLVAMGAIKPTDDEAKEMEANAANQKPDPNTVYLEAAASEAEAKAAKARADTVKVLADAEVAQANTEKIRAETQAILSGEPPARAPDEPPDRKHELELEGMNLENVIKLRKLEREEADTQAVSSNAESVKHLADASVAIGEAAASLSECMDGFRDAVVALAEAQRETAESSRETAQRALEAINKPKRIVREKGRIVGLEA